MPVTRRVFVSMPADRWLSGQQNQVKWGIVEKIRAEGFEDQVVVGPAGSTGLAEGKPWTADVVRDVMSGCVGAAVIGLARWQVQTDKGPIPLPTEYNHYEGAVAHALGLPILAVIDERMEQRGFFDKTQDLIWIPPDATVSWLATPTFAGRFATWLKFVRKRFDVFLGYCSKSEGTARNVKQYLRSLGVKVLDWKEDFAPSGNILQEVQKAAALCTGGIFLFMKDDDLAGEGTPTQAAPRDNVVFEAGFFIHAKGKERVLVIREEGTKMPADLGGDIYLPLQDRSNIGPIEQLLHRFVSERL